MTGRKEVRPSLTPGPGDYEHETKKTAAQIYDEKIREKRRMTCRQSRFLDTLYRRKTSEVIWNRHKIYWNVSLNLLLIVDIQNKFLNIEFSSPECV